MSDYVRVESDWVLGLSGQDLGWFIASLNPCNLLEQGTIHAGGLRIHQSAKFVLVPVLEIRGLQLNGWTVVLILHLVPQVLLVGK